MSSRACLHSSSVAIGDYRKGCVVCSCVAVCLREQGSASCSVHVWSMQEGGCSLGAPMLAARGVLKTVNASPGQMQQLLAVSRAG